MGGGGGGEAGGEGVGGVEDVFLGGGGGAGEEGGDGLFVDLGWGGWFGMCGVVIVVG